MENISEYIERAEKKAGTQKELARMLGVTTSYIRNVKAKKSGLAVETCIELADFIKEDRLHVIAASGLVTEKDERKRKILESCFKKTSQAAGITAAAIVISVLTFAPMTPVQASQLNSNYVEYKLSAIEP